jgi:hypothetical protein
MINYIAPGERSQLTDSPLHKNERPPSPETPRGSLRSGPSYVRQKRNLNELMESGEQSYESEPTGVLGGWLPGRKPFD